MLSRLKVSNFAIVESLTIEFGAGLNVVTGETGAGKSIVIGAIDVITGGRADKSLIRSGAEQCVVEAEFTLGKPEAINAILEEGGLPTCDDGVLTLRRTLTPSSGRVFVNDSAATAQTLRRIGSLLVDIHGANDNQSLFSPDVQRQILDATIPKKAHDSLDAYAALYAEYRDLCARRTELSGEDTAALAREIDLLTYQAQEIRAAALTEADGEELIRDHANAANAEDLLALGTTATQLLTEAETSVLTLMGAVQHSLSDMARTFGDPAREWHEQARAIAVGVQELSRSIEATLSSIDGSPERLAALDARLSLVRKLQHKYGKGVPDVLAFVDRAESRLAELSARGERLADIDRAIATLEPRLAKAAAALTALREAAAATLAPAISRELRSLGFAAAAFSITVDPSDGGRDAAATRFTASGVDDIEFVIAPNPGEAPRPLRAVASSGETARIMLALKTVLARHDTIATLIFDEIDANIGGEIGNAVGAKMRSIGQHAHQVLCITHLPHVAVYGDSHFTVHKSVAAGRTRTDITLLDREGRVREIARMLGGESRTTVTLEHAAQMLDRLPDD
ncbi:MAG: DNA repair protein RecN [Kiritimatiellaeota bacterium]|nr:DNA repair protein RecN [Kiritimatiellota bacterium]